jgi:hypothetical protein
VQLQVSCIGATTNTGGSLAPAGAPSNTISIPAGGFTETTVTCPAGAIAVAPGYSVGGGGSHAYLEESLPADNGQAWTFGFYSPNGDNAQASVHCYALLLTDGTTLVENSQYMTFQIFPGETNNPYNLDVGNEAAVGSYSLPHDGSVYLAGREPQGRTELFHLIDTSTSPQTVTEGLIVLRNTTNTPSGPAGAGTRGANPSGASTSGASTRGANASGATQGTTMTKGWGLNNGRRSHHGRRAHRRGHRH